MHIAYYYIQFLTVLTNILRTYYAPEIGIRAFYTLCNLNFMTV